MSEEDFDVLVLENGACKMELVLARLHHLRDVLLADVPGE